MRTPVPAPAATAGPPPPRDAAGERSTAGADQPAGPAPDAPGVPAEPDAGGTAGGAGDGTDPGGTAATGVTTGATRAVGPAAGGRWDRWWAVAAWVVVALGVGLRVRQWLSDRSFWQDEAALWLAMKGEDLAGLARPLRLAQAAPVGWLWSEHGIMAAFGDHERAARLLPLLFGCGTVPVALLLARRLLGPVAAFAGTVLVAFAPLLVYYSTEFKQYSADAFLAPLLVLLGVRLAGRDRPRARDLVALSGTAAVGIWFSHAAVLATAGVFGALGVLALLDRAWRRLGLLVLAAVLPVAGVVVEYVVSLSKTLGNDGLHGYWEGQGGFPPANPGDLYRWAATSTPRLLDRPVGLGPVTLLEELLVLALAVVGLGVLARRRGRELAVVLAPLAVLFAAAVAQAYPVADRLVLFAVPTVLLVLAAGIDLLPDPAAWTEERWRAGLARWRTTVAVLAVLAVAALAGPVLRQAGRDAADPITNEETRPVVQYVADRLRPGDAVLIDTSKYPVQVYGPRFGMDPAMVRVVAAPGASCQPGLAEKRLRQRYERVWLVYGHWFGSLPPVTRAGYRAHLATIGRHADGISTPGAGADLYDLTRPADDPARAAAVLRQPGATCLYIP